jgi:transposase
MHPTYEELFAQNQILIQQVKELFLENQQLKVEINELKEKVRILEEKLNTNSSNSSKPSSQDPYRKPKRQKPSGKSQGAQLGHKGYKRQIAPADQVDVIHELKPTDCPNCKSSSFDEIISTDVRQVTELPEAPPQITQYNIHTCRCGRCGKHVKAEIPNEAQYGFGPRLMGLITSLTGEFRLSKRQVTALMGKFGVKICSGSVCKIHERASQILAVPYEDIRQYTLSQKKLNADETSWKTLAQRRWMWVGVSQDSVFFKIKVSRSSEAFRDVFGNFNGTLTTDRYGAYNSHEGKQQLCWGHADRDFQKISERGGIDESIGEELKKSADDLFRFWNHFKAGFISREDLISHFEKEIMEDVKVLLKAGAAHEETHSKTKATCLDFFNKFESLWVFLYEEGVEPTNNKAERSLRHGVILRKLTYGSQSEKGQVFVERILTVAGTLKERAKDTLGYLAACFKSYIEGRPAPPILEY